MRLLLMNIEFPPVGGGAATQSYFIARELAKQNVDVTVVTSRHGALKRKESIEGIKIFRIPTLRRRCDYVTPVEIMVYILSNTFHAARLIKKIPFDFLLVFFAIPCGLSALVLKKMLNIPYVISLRGADVPYFEPNVYNTIYRLSIPFFKAVCKNAKHVTANSAALKNMASRYHAGEITVIPNGIDAQLFFPAEHPHETLNILSAGRLVPRKDYKTLLYGISDVLKKTTRPVKARIIGDGPLMKELCRLCASLNLSEAVQFSGSMSHDAMPAAYREADMFVSTSLNEGMPNVILEAMACGLPVLSTNIPAVEGLVLDHGNGRLFTRKDPASAASAILDVAENKGKRKSMGETSLKLSLNYSVAKTAEMYLRLMS